jgi:hypothetical protein
MSLFENFHTLLIARTHGMQGANKRVWVIDQWATNRRSVVIQGSQNGKVNDNEPLDETTN